MIVLLTRHSNWKIGVFEVSNDCDVVTRRFGPIWVPTVDRMSESWPPEKTGSISNTSSLKNLCVGRVRAPAAAPAASEAPAETID